MTTPRRRIAAALVLAVLVGAACRRAEQSPNPPSATPTNAASATPTATPSVPVPSPSAQPAGGAAPSAVTATGASCTLDGSWTGTLPQSTSPFSLSPVTSTFSPGGLVAWGTNLARFTGTWRVDAGTLHITDTSCTIPPAACPPTQVGRYTVVFTPACDGVTFQIVEDGCDGRRPALTGLHLQRAPNP